MGGKSDLNYLLKNMEPSLNEGVFVFATVQDKNVLNEASIIACIDESEGLSVVLAKEIADDLNLEYDFIARWITLNVYSSLNAVGLTAAVSKALAKQNISCNIVAGFHHDHIFVPKDDALKAVKALKNIKNNE